MSEGYHRIKNNKGQCQLNSYYMNRLSWMQDKAKSCRNRPEFTSR